VVARRVVEHEVVDDWRTGSIASQASVRCKPARSDHWSSAGAIGSPEPFRVQRFALLHERTIAAPKKERNPRPLEIRLNQAVHRVSRCRSSTRIPVRMVPSVSRGTAPRSWDSDSHMCVRSRFCWGRYWCPHRLLTP